MKQCVRCGIEFKPYREIQIYCTPKCNKEAWYLRSTNQSEYKPRTSKGRWTHCSGKYIMIKVNGILYYEHRIIMEQHLGRKLKSTEIVHHIDGNPQNNDISNLELLNSQSEHAKMHGLGTHIR